MKKHLKLIPVCLCILGFWSCQTLATMYSRVKQPKMEMTNTERLNYYEPFLSDTATVQIYALKDTTAVLKAFNRDFDLPLVFVENTQTHQVYKFENCFDDLKYQVQDINTGHLNDSILEPITKENDSLYQIYHEWKSFVPDQSKLVYSSKSTDTTSQKEWKIYWISGAFMGKKFRRLTLPIREIKNTKSLTILDMSMDKVESK